MEILGLLGLIGLFGLVALARPVPRACPGGLVRAAGLLGLLGLVGFWIPGAGAAGAFGALSLWQHPNPLLHRIGSMGFLGVAGIFPLAFSV
ncbi:MAG: hypothetical protein EBR88_07090 [Betaproteobacteria bacterium]|jgi:hypothetical protein|nr:hypothetical protein [Betaproteobacteria bacterium]